MSEHGRMQMIGEAIIILLVLGLFGYFFFGFSVRSTHVMSSRVHSVPVRAGSAEIDALSVALNIYMLECGAFPTTAQGLEALVTDQGVTGWGGPYLSGTNVPPDSWGTPYRYSATTNGFRIVSAGSDALFGTADDITN